MALQSRKKIEEMIVYIARHLCSKEEYEAVTAYLPYCGDNALYALYDQYREALDENLVKHKESR